MLLLISYSCVYLFVLIRYLLGCRFEVIGFNTSFTCQLFLILCIFLYIFVSASIVIPLMRITSFGIKSRLSFVPTYLVLVLFMKTKKPFKFIFVKFTEIGLLICVFFEVSKVGLVFSNLIWVQSLDSKGFGSLLKNSPLLVEEALKKTSGFWKIWKIWQGNKC